MAKNQTNKAAPKDAAAENQVFGSAPAAPEGATAAQATQPTEKTVTMSKSQFEALMGRLESLETGALERSPAQDSDVFNPLKEVKEQRQVRVAYHGDNLVIGYLPKIGVDGRARYLFPYTDPDTKERRNKVELVLLKPDGKQDTEVVDFYHFAENAIMLPATIISQKDIGEIIEQGLVKQRVWTGSKVEETGARIMSGSKEQKFVYEVEHKGKKLNLSAEVINIK